MGTAKPIPTTAPTAHGLSGYQLQSSMTNPYASNYQAPMSVPGSTQLNAFGAPLYSNNAYGTSNRVANTNVNTGALINSPQPGPAPAAQPTSAPSGPSPDEVYRQRMASEINQGYDNYFNQLDSMMSGLGDQRTAQESQISSQYTGNLTDLGLQRESNLGDLGTQERKTQETQVKTLKDISNNIRNLMQAGNTYLGSRGAGDSSAVNQYGYALTKLGSQQRGDVVSQTNSIMSDIADRKSKLDNVYMQEKTRLATERDTAIQGVAQWFAEAQNQIKQARAQGELGKSQDLQNVTKEAYNIALQQLNTIQNFTNQRMQQLESWALSNSKNLSEAKSNLASISQYVAPTQAYSAISGTPQFDAQGNMGVDLRGGVGTGFGLTEDQKRLLGLSR